MATITSTAGGNWNAGATWVGGVAPSSTDDVVIEDGDDVTVTANATCKSLVNGGAANVCTLSINDGITLTVTGNVVCNGNSVLRASGSGTGKLKVGGTFTQSAGSSTAFAGAVNSGSTLIVEFIPPSSGGPLIGVLAGGISQ